MNYFAHGHGVIGRPYVLAGTALPDWLAAADRRARLRRERIRDDGDPRARELALGVARHLDDDERFHRSPEFQRTESDVTGLLRQVSGDPCQRVWFLGHVLSELLLDAWLIREAPERLDAYYDALDEVDPQRIESTAAPWLTRTPRRLAETIDSFRAWRYLYSYVDDEGLFARLRGVARRVGLPEPDPALRRALAPARDLVYERATSLLRVECA